MFGPLSSDEVKRFVQSVEQFSARELASGCHGVAYTMFGKRPIPLWMPPIPRGKSPFLIGSKLVALFYEIADEALLAELEAGVIIDGPLCLILFIDAKTEPCPSKRILDVGAEEMGARLWQFSETVLLAELRATKGAAVTEKADAAARIIDALEHYENPGWEAKTPERTLFYRCVVGRIQGGDSPESWMVKMEKPYIRPKRRIGEPPAPDPPPELCYSTLAADIDAFIGKLKAA